MVVALTPLLCGLVQRDDAVWRGHLAIQSRVSHQLVAPKSKHVSYGKAEVEPIRGYMQFLRCHLRALRS
jgi:hypothetical protein